MTRPGRRRRADSPYVDQAARLAAWLRDRREQAQLSQDQLAARAKVAVATVRKIETGAVIEPGYFTILALQRALGTRYEDTAVLPLASFCRPCGLLQNAGRSTLEWIAADGRVRGAFGAMSRGRLAWGAAMNCRAGPGRSSGLRRSVR